MRVITIKHTHLFRSHNMFEKISAVLRRFLLKRSINSYSKQLERINGEVRGLLEFKKAILFHLQSTRNELSELMKEVDDV